MRLPSRGARGSSSASAQYFHRDVLSFDRPISHQDWYRPFIEKHATSSNGFALSESQRHAIPLAGKVIKVNISDLNSANAALLECAINSQAPPRSTLDLEHRTRTAILQTDKQMYLEAVSVLHACNTISLHLKEYMDLSRRQVFVHQDLKLIRTITLKVPFIESAFPHITQLLKDRSALKKTTLSLHLHTADQQRLMWSFDEDPAPE